MTDLRKEFLKLPDSLRKAYVSLTLGWGIHMGIVTLLFLDDRKIVIQNIAIFAFVVFFVMIKRRNWARTLCLISNLLLMLFYVFTALLMVGGRPAIAALAGINTGIFVVASWYLIKKETVAYFKSLMPQADESENR